MLMSSFTNLFLVFYYVESGCDSASRRFFHFLVQFRLLRVSCAGYYVFRDCFLGFKLRRVLVSGVGEYVCPAEVAC